MQAEAAGRLCTRSVSELYSTDEVELLLEELRALEPRAPAGEDSREYEIAGSQTGGGTHWSPDGTVHSWDSHPHYRRTPPLPPARIAPIYCYAGHLRTSVGALRFFIAVCFHLFFFNIVILNCQILH